MTANLHTDIAAGAAATAAVLNAPLGQLDAHINPTVVPASDVAGTNTTVTTAGTYYAPASYEVSFTPSYTGQVFLIAVDISHLYSGTAGTTTAIVRITDSVNATVVDYFGRAATSATTFSTAGQLHVTRAWTAGAGDVGVVRKAKVYVTHTVNASVVSCQYSSVQAISH